MTRVCKDNLFARVPADLPDEGIESLARGPGARIERIVSRGHASAPGFWYDQDQDEFVLVVQGQACLVFEGQALPVDMGPGDWLIIPAHQRHRVDWTDPDQDTIWLAVHYDGDKGGVP